MQRAVWEGCAASEYLTTLAPHEGGGAQDSRFSVAVTLASVSLDLFAQIVPLDGASSAPGSLTSDVMSTDSMSTIVNGLIGLRNARSPDDLLYRTIGFNDSLIEGIAEKANRDDYVATDAPRVLGALEAISLRARRSLSGIPITTAS